MSKDKSASRTWGLETKSRDAVAASLTVPWGVLDQPSAIAAGVAPVVGLQELAAQAPGAVLAVLTGAELAELARRWGVLIRCTLATVVNLGANDPAVLAGKFTEASPLEVSNAQRGHRVRASLYTVAVEQEPSVTTLHGEVQAEN